MSESPVSSKARWEDVEIGDTDTLPTKESAKKYGDLWMLHGIDSKSRHLRWSALHFCIYGWALEAAEKGCAAAMRALGIQSTNKDKLKKKKKVHAGADFEASLTTLIQCNAFVDSLDHKCRTPLMLAAAANLTHVVKILLDSGSDMNITDIDGNSALHFASAFGCASVMVILEARNANQNLLNLSSKSPIEMAGKCRDLLPLFFECETYNKK